MEVNALNNDKFNEQTGEFVMPFTIYTRSGKIYAHANSMWQPEKGMQSGSYIGKITLGPGQAKTGYIVTLSDNNIFEMEEGEELPVVVFWNSDLGHDFAYTMYDFAECGYQAPPPW